MPVRVRSVHTVYIYIYLFRYGMAKPPKFWTIDGEGIFVKMDGVVKGVGEAQVRKTVFLSRLYIEMRCHFAKTGSG
jgi:hypothetical protein